MLRWPPNIRLWLVLIALVGMEQSIALGLSQNTCRFLSLLAPFMIQSHTWTLPFQLLSHLPSMHTRPWQLHHRSQRQLQMLLKLHTAALPLLLLLTPNISLRCATPYTSRDLWQILHACRPLHGADRHPTLPPAVLDLQIGHDTNRHVKLLGNMATPQTGVICWPWHCSSSDMPGIGQMQSS